MDAQLLLEFSEAIREERRLEGLIAGATADDARDLGRLLTGVRRSVGALQDSLLSTYNFAFVECRDIGHVWQRRDQQIVDNYLVRILVCSRCQTERHESFTRYGELDGRNYTHAADYLMPKGVESGDRPRLTKAFWRGITFMQAQRA